MDKSTVNLIIEYTDFEVYEKNGKYYCLDEDCVFKSLDLVAKERSMDLDDLDDLDVINRHDLLQRVTNIFWKR